MAQRTEHDRKPQSGVPTTGHEWDGIHELNTPLPRWWLWLFYATIIWSVGYWVVYPAWPLVSSYSKGVLAWQSRAAVVSDLDMLKAQRGAMMTRLAAAPLGDIESTPQLLDFARALGRIAFADNCAPCHGAGGGGARGYPNLVDNDWLWGGKLSDIAQTIRHGVRSGDPDGHQGNMPPWSGTLKPAQISTVADYVRSLSGLSVEPGADLAAGKTIFADNCSPCHGPDGKGNRQVGAKNLTDDIWLYGSDKRTLVQTISSGRGGVMPAWGAKLDDATVKALAVYVHTFGGGED